jgi:hypothetical protein
MTTNSSLTPGQPLELGPAHSTGMLSTTSAACSANNVVSATRPRRLH